MPKVGDSGKPKPKKTTEKVPVKVDPQNIWVCPDCGKTHRGFVQQFCRNESCPGKDKECIACSGTGVNSRGGVCYPCRGTGKLRWQIYR